MDERAEHQKVPDDVTQTSSVPSPKQTSPAPTSSEPTTRARSEECTILSWMGVAKAMPSVKRYVCLDFETNGFHTAGAAREDRPWPFASFPIQLAVVIVEGGEIQPAYDTTIRGAQQLVPWVRENVPVTMQQIHGGVSFNRMLADLAELLQLGDVIVAHNALFDMDMALHTTASRLEGEREYEVDWAALNKILRTPTFCTMRCAWSKRRWPRPPRLIKLCEHFQVEFEEDGAHDARYDSMKLAECVQEALRRGEMMDSARMDAYQDRPAGIRVAAQRQATTTSRQHNPLDRVVG